MMATLRVNDDDRRPRLGEIASRGSASLKGIGLPSGLDATKGTTGARAVRADATLTLCAPKIGLRLAAATGNLFLADISVPASVVERVTGRGGPVFAAGPIIELIGTPAR
ncbi:MAG: hypothetical protein ABIQ73_20695 [Acidimicrobiales bacterium]